MQKTVIHTDLAPDAIGAYSQAIKVDQTVYLSGQIPLLPETMMLVSGGIEEQIEQVLKNLTAVAQAAGGGLADIVKLNIYLTDMADFPVVNEKMAAHFSQPYPARAAIGVAELPKNSRVEMDAVMVLVDD
ncbi:RidA family protein [Cycloclasticus sp.]|uniref:RidA family protein n=1 Tax=Cycloclasticus sp. TaxID=2024830 RepID=UPI000C0ECB9B|nr:RidA family protein [Cycloclasticus sp.]PHR50958.1 MAG: reactive intermediate/imine deaminase [Cycloclasticus sp.]